MTFSRRWLVLFAMGALPLALSGLLPLLRALTAAWALLLIALALVDRLRMPPLSLLTASREVPDRLSLGVEDEVMLQVRNGSAAPARLELRDTPPPTLACDVADPTFLFDLQPHVRLQVSYHLKPTVRGDYLFGDLYLRVHGPLGLVHRIFQIPAGQGVKVYPNLREVAALALAARRGRLQQSGQRKVRMQGIGHDFESLRDYQPDDEMRRIDWKATARRGRLVARQYEVEQSQSVLLALDVGRTMRAEIDGVAKLEYAIKAALTLATVAAEADDRVGLLVFADQVRAFIPPGKGKVQVHAILEALYNMQADLTEPDYQAAFAYLQARWRRRSLVVCFTDLWDPDSSYRTIAALAGLQPRHLAVTVTLLDPRVLRASRQVCEHALDLYTRAVAIQMLEDRDEANAALTRRGVLVIDSPADRLSAELVSHYLQVKERRRL